MTMAMLCDDAVRREILRHPAIPQSMLSANVWYRDYYNVPRAGIHCAHGR
jgi:hypothetical protein